MERSTGPSQKRSVSSRLPNALEMLRRIANLRYPDEEVRSEVQAAHSVITKRLQDEFTVKVQSTTKNFWPELWEEDWRALEVLRVMRDLLRQFWEAKDEHSRDWYIHRAREYYQRFMIQREFRQQLKEATTIERLASLNIEMDRRLDKPPARNLFEDALFKLQERTRKASLAPCICENAVATPLPGIRNDQLSDEKNEEGCPHPYFLRSKKRRKYCSPKCFHQGTLKIKRRSWDAHKDKWRKK